MSSVNAVVADANVLLSAVSGRAALRVFTEYNVSVHVSEFNELEVKEYLPLFAAKYKLPTEQLEMQWLLLSKQLHSEDEYRSFLEGAEKDMRDRDPEDAHALALARHLSLPLWSNDRDFEDIDVKCFPTAQLLKLLESSECSK